MTDGRLRRTLVGAGRGLLSQVARTPGGRTALGRAVRELNAALENTTYGDSYFGHAHGAGLSGYATYDRATSNADVAAYLLWRFLPARRTLDVGCAMGFVVQALSELGADAQGTDVSAYAVEHAPPAVRSRLRVGDARGRLPYGDGDFDVVTALETLEHLPQDAIPAVLAELRRVSAGFVVATIPSFGHNEHGPGGWFDGKVRDAVLQDYIARGDGYDGPVPVADLMRDATGQPVEGHLTIASFRWWTQRFAAAGLERCGEVERRMHPQIARFGLSEAWNLYVLRTPGTALPPDDLRSAGEIARAEARLGLASR